MGNIARIAFFEQRMGRVNRPFCMVPWIYRYLLFENIVGPGYKMTTLLLASVVKPAYNSSGVLEK
jgi:hypothetical protein